MRENNVPQELVFANDMQRAGDYQLSRKYYKKFLLESPTHPLRFKAFFEIADNYFYENNFVKTREVYRQFQVYCKAQVQLTEEESGWVDAYSRLVMSRLQKI